MTSTPECLTCPFNVGFEPKEGKMLTVCASPSDRCDNLRESTIDRIAQWTRMMAVAMTTRTGVLKFDDLHDNDLLEVVTSAPGIAYGEAGSLIGRRVCMEIVRINGTSLTGSIRSDNYQGPTIQDTLRNVMEPGTGITVCGSFERTAIKDGIWTGKSIPGALHVGRFIQYQPDNRDEYLIGLYLQEIILRNENQDIAMRLFSTDPGKHRQAPPLTN